jgi:hypothetical protein
VAKSTESIEDDSLYESSNFDDQAEEEDTESMARGISPQREIEIGLNEYLEEMRARQAKVQVHDQSSADVDPNVFY